MEEKVRETLNFLVQNDEHPERGIILKRPDGEGFYRDNRDLGFFESWYDNGQRNVYCQIKKDGELHGLFESWFPNGQLAISCTYQDNILHGPFEEWHENGQIKYRCTYDEGKKDGLYETYAKGGLRLKAFTYKADKLDGPYEKYFPDSRYYNRATYKDGRIDGTFVRVERGGKVSDITEFKEGKQEGLDASFWRNNKLQSRCYYKDDKPDGLYEYWHENGQLSNRWNYKDGEIDGLVEHWDENGERESCSMYILGEEIAMKSYTDPEDSFGDQSYFEGLGNNIIQQTIKTESTVMEQKEFDLDAFEKEVISEVLDSFVYESSFQNSSFAEDLKDIFAEHMEERNTLSEFPGEVSRYGCGGGAIGDFVYYEDTKKFYDEHSDDIERAIDETGVGSQLDSPRYNSATWLVVELFASELEDYINSSLMLDVDLSELFEDKSIEDLLSISDGGGIQDISVAAAETLTERISNGDLSIDELLLVEGSSKSEVVEEAASVALENLMDSQGLTYEELAKIRSKSKIDRTCERAENCLLDGDYIKPEKVAEMKKSKGIKL